MNLASKEMVMEKLKDVFDPELQISIVELGLIYDVAVEGDTVKVSYTLTSPGCPVGPQLLNGAKMVLEDLEGVDEASVQLVWDPFWSPDLINPEARAALGF